MRPLYSGRIWTDLVTAVRKELGPPASGFFVITPNSPIRGIMKGNQLHILCENGFVMDTLNKPDVLEIISRKASAMLQRPITVRVMDKNVRATKNPKMENLLNFGRSHGDIIKIKE